MLSVASRTALAAMGEEVNMHAAGCGGLGCAPGCSELATTASIQHKWHDTPGDTQEAPTLSYSGCYGSSWFAGNVPCTAHPRGCPASCASEAPSPLRAQRVRRGLSTLSDSEWARVVRALWLMKNTSTADGQARCPNPCDGSVCDGQGDGPCSCDPCPACGKSGGGGAVTFSV